MSIRRAGLATFLLILLAALASIPSTARTIQAQSAGDPPTPTPETYHIYLPGVTLERYHLARRLGFGISGGKRLETFGPAVSELKAGWYSDWSTKSDPYEPDGIEYAQLIELHQDLSCGLFHHGDREVCPYSEPYSYTHARSAERIQQMARLQPGSIWMIGNEMDRPDWSQCILFNEDFECIRWRHGGQNEMLPEVYAVAYNDLYHLIKSADPSARIAIGGVVQVTPLRLAYLTEVWDSYQRRFGRPMPVDIWNVHLFILREAADSYGADVPPGSDAEIGELYEDAEHIDRQIFDEQVRAMRAWMKERGQQEKPLVISEYGVLYHHIPELDSFEAVRDYMLWTFDYFTGTRDCNLGQPSDDCRLVQRWLWFSLNETGSMNPHAELFDKNTNQLSPLGAAFADYAKKNLEDLK